MIREMPRPSDETSVLMVPGYTNSGPQHWQSLWEYAHPEYKRVNQRDWDQPQLTEWVETLDRAISEAPGRIVLVAHSLGCMTVAKWAGKHSREISGALLVAPADPELPLWPENIKEFAPIPLVKLPFRNILVASSNDAFLSLERARVFARAWGSELVDIGQAGHVATADGYGSWPQGEHFLRKLITYP
jgi:predicted alpha/beta hydrolase family esterase